MEPDCPIQVQLQFRPSSTLVTSYRCSRAVPVWRTYFLDGSQLFEVGLIDSGRWWRQQTESCFSDVPSVAGMVSRRITTVWVWPSWLKPLNTPVTGLEDDFQVCCRYGGKHVELTITVGLTVGIHHKTTSHTPRSAPKRHIWLWASLDLIARHLRRDTHDDC